MNWSTQRPNTYVPLPTNSEDETLHDAVKEYWRERAEKAERSWEKACETRYDAVVERDGWEQKCAELFKDFQDMEDERDRMEENYLAVDLALTEVVAQRDSAKAEVLRLRSEGLATSDISRKDIEEAIDLWHDSGGSLITRIWNLVTGDNPTTDPAEDLAQELFEVATAGSGLSWASQFEGTTERYLRIARHLLQSKEV